MLDDYLGPRTDTRVEEQLPGRGGLDLVPDVMTSLLLGRLAQQAER